MKTKPIGDDTLGADIKLRSAKAAKSLLCGPLSAPGASSKKRIGKPPT